jgi:hypothetical protein
MKIIYDQKVNQKKENILFLNHLFFFVFFYLFISFIYLFILLLRSRLIHCGAGPHGRPPGPVRLVR